MTVESISPVGSSTANASASLAPAADGGARWYAAFGEQFPTGLMALDSTFTVQWASPGITPVLGFQPGELIGQTVFGLLHPDDYDRIAPMAQAMVADAGAITDERSAAKGAEIDVRALHRNGTWVPVGVAGRLIDSEGNLLVVLRDAADRAALSRVIERIGLGASLDDALLAVVELANANFATKRAAIVVDLDGITTISASSAPLGLDPALALASVRDGRRTASAVAEVGGSWVTSVESASGDIVGAIVLPVLRDGGATPFDIEVLDRVRQLAGVAVTRSLDDQSLRREATYDHLTGLLTRREFERALSSALARIDSGPVSVLFIDLDGFKLVNDLHGHAFGDEVLAASAERLREAVRGVDLVGRLGGDEFGVLCRATGPDVIEELASRLRDALSRPIPVEHLELRISGSVGSATTEEPIAVAELLRRADAAMYSEKSRRR